MMAGVLEEKAVHEMFDIAQYSVDDKASVGEFLGRYDYLPDLLAEAVLPVERVFGKDTTISLSLLDDHDSDDDVRLIAGIQMNLSVAAARELRTQFYCDLWNANIHRAKDRLFFMLNFIDG